MEWQRTSSPCRKRFGTSFGTLCSVARPVAGPVQNGRSANSIGVLHTGAGHGPGHLVRASLLDVPEHARCPGPVRAIWKVRSGSRQCDGNVPWHRHPCPAGNLTRGVIANATGCFRATQERFNLDPTLGSWSDLGELMIDFELSQFP